MGITQDWNPNARGWGDPWADLRRSHEGVFVVAGLCGTMLGVDVARFDGSAAAERFIDDFLQGKIPVLMGHEAWREMVTDARGRRDIPAAQLRELRRMGREGMTATIGGPLLTADRVCRHYAEGGSAATLRAAEPSPDDEAYRHYAWAGEWPA